MKNKREVDRDRGLLYAFRYLLAENFVRRRIKGIILKWIHISGRIGRLGLGGAQKKKNKKGKKVSWRPRRRRIPCGADKPKA
jgi:hypothetical protein